MLYRSILYILLSVIISKSNTAAKNLNYAMDEVLQDNYAKSPHSEKKLERCTAYNKASVQVTNKIEGKTTVLVLDMKQALSHETLKLKGVRCCSTKNDENGLYLEIENSKIKKQIFRGWIFVKNASIFGLEDAKYDINLVKCF